MCLHHVMINYLYLIFGHFSRILVCFPTSVSLYTYFIMAKRQGFPKPEVMEGALGYSSASFSKPSFANERFYSDLMQFDDGSDRINREYEEHLYISHHATPSIVSTECNGVKEPQTELTMAGSHAIEVAPFDSLGYYRYEVNILFTFGMNIRLLCSQSEVDEMRRVAQMTRPGSDNPPPTLCKLPTEIRDIIYGFVCDDPESRTVTNCTDDIKGTFTRGIADPSGFFFPMWSDMALLRVNKSLRREVLPHVYRKTTFHVEDMDDLVMFLTAIGDIGRDNVESLSFPLESRISLAALWKDQPESAEVHHLRLPFIHTSNCIMLLKACKRLKHLVLRMEAEILDNRDIADFLSDPCIQGLSELRVKDVCIESLDGEILDSSELVIALKNRIEGL
ncbi:hypothetical protein EJ05DRAFT_155684 [Pseudovirgaria hyperparasitica]|uniref:F-box domain-containing protein n=1 Tax=Pseudovirgaria hyperparasitica TaxID=470096 RepID=A0A6A6VWS8_9PEZI|nr:uncharacterized protein EJ05DRAFT_155684 [Pseudovirgaria hyperparasitica]KAF2754309.1 hypothetical protein EJ05DRAFT_155684 [Pseudovirgaria hyperparasitica]